MKLERHLQVVANLAFLNILEVGSQARLHQRLIALVRFGIFAIFSEIKGRFGSCSLDPAELTVAFDAPPNSAEIKHATPHFYLEFSFLLELSAYAPSTLFTGAIVPVWEPILDPRVEEQLPLSCSTLRSEKTQQNHLSLDGFKVCLNYMESDGRFPTLGSKNIILSLV